ncbi:MAG: phage portal protein [Candidatus Peribacteraceae bacterium]|nr:phage portal protein [Candidatus Peribacteraceae bacterium]
MALNLKNWFKGINFRLGGSAISVMEIPPGWNYEAYLRVYGEVGWLFAANNIISESVADVKWDLYEKDNGQKGDLVENHPLIDMFAYVNPFQTKYQFLQLLQLYIGLVGEAFIVLNFNRLGVPAEMWLAPPQNMVVVPSSETYISHYVYRKGVGRMRLEVPEVIHIMNPNPHNPYRGLGTAQTIGVDLDSEKYAVRYQNRLFYNDATPGLMIEYPEIPEKKERDKIREEWNEIHQGWRNARKTGFLWGGAKANTLALTNRDMEYWRLRKINRETIIGAYHIPTSMLGIEGPGSRARVEADELVFSKYVLKPALTRLKESFNEQLVPLFDDGYILDFDDVVPENREAVVTEVEKLYPAGVITLQEARVKLGLDAEPEEGDTFAAPPSPMDFAYKEAKHASLVNRRFDEEQKEARWKLMADHAEENEKLFKKLFKRLWFEQMDAIVEEYAITQETIDVDAAANQWNESLTPMITEIYEGAFDLATEGGELSPAHRQVGDGLNPAALEWIATRSLSLAQMVNGTTKEELRKALALGFEEGESIPQLTKRIKTYYQNGYERRANMVARTEVIAASNEGALQGYEHEGIEKAEFYAALDERLCVECEALHGVIYPINETHGVIPVHPDCRCTFIPIVD